MLASLGGKGQICHRCHEHQAAARRRKGRGSSWRTASRLSKPLWCRERSGVLALGGYACPGPAAAVAAPCPQGEWARVKAPGRGRPPAWELTKQCCSSLWDWKQLPVGHRQPDMTGTGWAARGDRLMQSMRCRGSPKLSWYPLVLAGSRAGEAEAPRTGCGLLAHLPSWVGGFSPSRGSGAECQPAREAAANTFFAIFSSEASCCWFQRIFFSLPVNSKSFPSFTFYSGMLPAPFGFDLH